MEALDPPAQLVLRSTPEAESGPALRAAPPATAQAGAPPTRPDLTRTLEASLALVAFVIAVRGLQLALAVLFAPDAIGPGSELLRGSFATLQYAALARIAWVHWWPLVRPARRPS